jgi:hypothetical protein
LEICASSALHLTTVGGQTWRGQGAGAEHLTGGGHLTSGQRALGQGGHSPPGFAHLLQSKITGCGLGTELFNTYLLRSGTAGHSVFNIYLLRSGSAGQGGIVLFNTNILRSGSRQAVHGAHLGHLQPRPLLKPSFVGLLKNDLLRINPRSIPRSNIKPGITCEFAISTLSNLHTLFPMN